MVSPNYDPRRTILIASSGRGGSTWLAEIVGTLPGYPMVWEPLHRAHNPACERHGFDWHTYVPPGRDEPLKLAYIERLVTGRDLGVPVVDNEHFVIGQYLRFRGLLIKVCRANLMLGWMLEHFPMRTVLMIRHPCAVVLSQMRHKSWRQVDVGTHPLPAGIEREFPHLPDIYARIRHREEAFAFLWALQTMVPMIQARDRLLLTSYERLVTEREAEVDRIFEYLDEPVPARAYQQLGVPSKTTQGGSNVASGKDPLRFWKESLSTVQVERILGIVREVGVDCYSDDLLPTGDLIG